MTSKIAAIANVAFHIFHAHVLRVSSITNTTSRRPEVDSPSSNTSNSSFAEAVRHIPGDALQQLLNNVNCIKPEDVGLNGLSDFDASSFTAPVIYIHITENEVCSIGMFVLRPGSRIPLHSHPDMFGIIRVMQGAVRIRSFTRLAASQLNGALTALSAHGAAKWQLTHLIIARPHQDSLITSSCQPCLLAPNVGNFHEITAVNGTALFLDILAPPYDHDLGTRECLFYREISLPCLPDYNGLGDITRGENPDDFPQQYGETSGLVYLTETHQPKDYWCDIAPYLGPSIT